MSVTKDQIFKIRYNEIYIHISNYTCLKTAKTIEKWSMDIPKPRKHLKNVKSLQNVLLRSNGLVRTVLSLTAYFFVTTYVFHGIAMLPIEFGFV